MCVCFLPLSRITAASPSRSSFLSPHPHFSPWLAQELSLAEGLHMEKRLFHSSFATVRPCPAHLAAPGALVVCVTSPGALFVCVTPLLFPSTTARRA